ncbi:CPCC family cysteine-rich protein [Staphylospora marina]|uniref:CPCC family cysteine-rich protein n=1 Tax=Staphylospora marina TaxID=2490858 RepID=UPI000F5C0D92|nr:CPCC family cysteine-rich protein [Staphylospora marina]
MAFPCPCCGFLTYEEEPDGTFDICPVCFWEDDPVQNRDPCFAEGANTVSLNQARENFRLHGAIELRFVRCMRKPLLHEIPDGAPGDASLFEENPEKE